jgi:hypothetical protein
MKHTLAKTAVLLLVLPVALYSCKKSNSSPTIVGNWTLAAISGTTTSQSTSSAPVVTTSYSYSGSVLTKSDTTTVTQITVTSETMSINNDGTYSVTENYEASTATVPVIHTFGGWWDYTQQRSPVAWWRSHYPRPGRSYVLYQIRHQQSDGVNGNR